MMKKQCAIVGGVLAAACTLMGLTGINDKKVAYAQENMLAEYVSQEFAPVIDGKLDEECWFSLEEVIITQDAYTSKGQIAETKATVRILWNESGLYFVAEVTDYTPNKSDTCNFWVSETYCGQFGQNITPPYYPTVDGAYYLCLNPEGENQKYNIDVADRYVDMSGKYTVATTCTEYGYTVEAYVPLYGEKALKLGNSIGFEVSIDNYLEEGATRDHYVVWKGVRSYGHDYWETPYGCSEIRLVDRLDINGSPSKVQSSDDTSLKEDSSSMQNSNSQVSEQDDVSSGCSSSVSGASLAISVLVGMGLLKLKKVNDESIP